MLRLTALLTSLLITGLAHAADEKPATPPPVKPGWTVLPDEVPDGKVDELVNEDDHVRVEELRVRGQTKRIKVHFKNKLIPDYEILISDAKFEPPRGLRGDGAGDRGTRVWSLLDY
ncbi:hypothetical protein [Pelomonas sp. KK5]|uniref:hypothetical protein n=1 Tax=Pelomonas sp. KK5 TaxID=1855730 RepID=UPI00097C8AEA|nr:hypothetical protein [Pelomonas sp. KK5]